MTAQQTEPGKQARQGREHGKSAARAETGLEKQVMEVVGISLKG